MPATLSSRPFGTNAGYDPYGDALPSFGNMTPSYMSLPNGGSSGMGMPSGDAGGGGFDPMSLVPGAGTFLSGIFGMINANKQREKDRQLQLQLAGISDANSRDLNASRTALTESELDPFRQQMSQASDLSKLDRLERGTRTPVSVSIAGGPGAPFTKTGGYSYTKSPELTKAASAIKQSVLAGNGAPSMTNPNNYGKTSAIDVIGVMNGTKDPTSPNAFATGAPSAGTGQSSAAANVIRQAYRQYLHRDPTDAEILSQTGNGTFMANDPRLQASVQNIMNSSEALGGFKPSYARG